MSDLADSVLPLIRTRADLHRWGASNEYGGQMHDAVAILQAASVGGDPSDVFAVTQRAIASALKVIMRADDSSGIIGDACRALLDLHPQVAVQATPPVAKLVDWMMKFQFDNECDFSTIAALLKPLPCAMRLSSSTLVLVRRAASLGTPRWRWGARSRRWTAV